MHDSYGVKVKRSKHTCSLIRFLYKLIQKFFIGEKKRPVIWEETEFHDNVSYYRMNEKGEIFRETDGLTIEELDKKFAAFKKRVEQ